MKYISCVLLVLLFASCKKTQGDIEITGTANGVTFGNVIIRDQANTNVFRTDIERGKFKVKEFLQYSGYYKFLFASSATKGTNREVEVYLEPGTYTVNIDQKKINDYPTITSSSQIQTQLSAYYTIIDTMRHQSRQKVISINNKMKSINGEDIKATSDIGAISKLQEEELKANQVDELEGFKTFMAKYPDNEVAAHIMKSLDYQDDPVAYYQLFQKFSDAAKSSDDGKELDEKLQQLSKLAPGSPAPNIDGMTNDGKYINFKAMHKKIILLDFWRSSDGTSRDNHEKIITQLSQLSDKGFGVVSVSFDTDKEKWLSAVSADKMDWPQITDLKGDDSANGPTWGIKSIPSYYLIDGDGKIVSRINDFADVPAAVDDYLKKH
ncbi:redoxin domain-containing protein [Mucilaginibacter corticis]|uniref:Redoxin domain-containing protein n=1 Tax=Mucilaginibacter corticis TaxID=2597670 RepID=A0A556MTG4_9SPHI|nr:TlpA disulfide reductase family protein [Mucilaginibacter corticis]TSJ43098.1 redoxin domain-containing protein [Mucilaginibacter corticis]